MMIGLVTGEGEGGGGGGGGGKSHCKVGTRWVRQKESCVLLFSSIPSRAPPARVLTSYRSPSTGPLLSSPMRC